MAHSQKRRWLAINVVGGIAVLGSYVHGLLTHPTTRGMLWGDIPAPLREVYGVTMWLAAAGYLVFLYTVLRRVNPADARIGSRPAFTIINSCCAAVVFPSALWLPLTFAYLDSPSAALFVLIRWDLIVVGTGAIGLILSVFHLRPRLSGWAGTLTVVALLFFALQTAFLDAFVWPAFFPSG